MTDLSSIQHAAALRLSAFPAFRGLRVIQTDESDIDSKIDAALGGLSQGFTQGAAILIATPSAQIRKSNAPRLWADPVRLAVACFERPLLNTPPQGTGRHADAWALLAARALLGWTPPGCARPLSPPLRRLHHPPHRQRQRHRHPHPRNLLRPPPPPPPRRARLHPGHPTMRHTDSRQRHTKTKKTGNRPTGPPPPSATTHPRSAPLTDFPLAPAPETRYSARHMDNRTDNSTRKPGDPSGQPAAFWRLVLWMWLLSAAAMFAFVLLRDYLSIH